MAIEEIKAMLPGMFYRKPSPEESPYKEIGDSVSKGDVIGLIEVMKSFHEVKSDVDGKIVSFKVEDSEAISPGDVLVEVQT